MKSPSRYIPSPAMAVAFVALLVAMGGTGYAHHKINGKKIADRTLPTRALKKQSVTSLEVLRRTLQGKHVRDKSLTGRQISDVYTASLKLKCPGGTVPLSGGCMETSNRGPGQAFVAAAQTCRNAGRRLPTPGELVAAASASGIVLDSNYELTAHAYVDAATASLFVTGVDNTPVLLNVGYNDATRKYRCVAPLNNN